MERGRARVILRRNYSGYSEFMQSNFEVNLMMGFVVTEVIMTNQNELTFALEQSSDKHHRDLKDVNISSDKVDAIDELYKDRIIQFIECRISQDYKFS